MASYFDLCKNDAFSADCFYTIADYYPIYLTGGMWAWYFRSKALSVFLLSFGITYVQLENWVLRVIFNQDGLNGYEQQMPARATQLIVYFISMIILLAEIYDIHQGLYVIFILAFFESVVIYARYYLEINTTNQLLIGGLFGLVDAIIHSAFIYYFVFKHINAVKKQWWFIWWGLKIDYLEVIDSFDGVDYETERKLTAMARAGGFVSHEEAWEFMDKHRPKTK